MESRPAMGSAVICRRPKPKTPCCHGPRSRVAHPHMARYRAMDADVELMLRVQRDEPGAFAELIERFRTRIFGRLYRILLDRQEAEDMTQEVFLRVYRIRRRYRPTARLATWLYHITQNVACNALRRRRRH